MIAVAKRLIPERYRQTVRRMLRRDRGQWCRVVMNREIQRYLKSLNLTQMDVLEISGTQFREGIPFHSYQTTAYPAYDVCRGPLAVEAFDLVIAEQVFEHVLRPDLAAQSVFQMLRPGGIFIIGTPFLLKMHGYPVDLYRWTEEGIRMLLTVAGFSAIETASWGNRWCLLMDMTADRRWTPYTPLLHSLRNEPLFPIVVWAFAHKAAIQQ
jgi:SAM-dependent methyltransferase